MLTLLHFQLTRRPSYSTLFNVLNTARSVRPVSSVPNQSVEATSHTMSRCRLRLKCHAYRAFPLRHSAPEHNVMLHSNSHPFCSLQWSNATKNRSSLADEVGILAMGIRNMGMIIPRRHAVNFHRRNLYVHILNSMVARIHMCCCFRTRIFFRPHQ